MEKFKICLFALLNVIFISVMAGSCSTVRMLKDHRGIDREFSVYVGYVMALSEGSMYENDVTIGFKDHDYMNPNGESVIGRCHPFIKEVDINRLYWNVASHEEKLILIAHELNHCVCFGSHVTYKLEDGCPSYMDAKQPSEKCMKNNFKKYLDEIRKGCDL